MTSQVAIEWEGGVTSGRWSPGTSAPAVVLAHGAGAGQDHPFMTAVREGLAAAGVAVLTFDYAYTHEGRKAPDRLPKLLAVHRAAADWCAARSDGVVLAGKSMGGRVGSHLAGDGGWQAIGLAYLGYPLVPLGSRPPRDTGHLQRITSPQWFFCGTRDRLSPPHLIVPLAESLPNARVTVIDDADHSFRLPKGRQVADPLAMLVAGIVELVNAS